jgi:hypothetical protein
MDFREQNQFYAIKSHDRFSTPADTSPILTPSSGKGPGSRTGFHVSNSGIPAFGDGCGEMIMSCQNP